MQEQMQRLQQQLEASQKVSSPSSGSGQTPERPAGPRPALPNQSRAKSTTASQKIGTQAGNSAHSVIIWQLFMDIFLRSLFPFQQHLLPLQPQQTSKSPLLSSMN